jgi:hypothetical protein
LRRTGISAKLQRDSRFRRNEFNVRNKKFKKIVNIIVLKGNLVVIPLKVYNMKTQKNIPDELIFKVLNNEASASENEIFREWLSHSPRNKKIFFRWKKYGRDQIVSKTTIR